MAEELHFKKKTYIIPEQVVDELEKYLHWIEKHVCCDEEVQQFFSTSKNGKKETKDERRSKDC